MWNIIIKLLLRAKRNVIIYKYLCTEYYISYISASRDDDGLQGVYTLICYTFIHRKLSCKWLVFLAKVLVKYFLFARDMVLATGRSCWFVSLFMTPFACILVISSSGFSFLSRLILSLYFLFLPDVPTLWSKNVSKQDLKDHVIWGFTIISTSLLVKFTFEIILGKMTNFLTVFANTCRCRAFTLFKKCVK